MALLILGIVLLITAAVLALPGVVKVRALGVFLAMIAGFGGLLAILFSAAVSVRDDQGGLVIRHFGPDLPANRVVAPNGEKGPQCEVLGPGWHFGYWPWQYSVEAVNTVTVDQGQVGVVVALDGKSLPDGTIYALPWESAEDMVDGSKFLGEGKGFRGPQLTILTPGRYRYNPRLFQITTKPALTVNAGEVAVVKANAGKIWNPADANQAQAINGTRLVPTGHVGIWDRALPPGAYNLHPDAHQFVKVQTTNRVYTYQDKKWAIKVRSKDGFTFPVDVRVSASISAADAPYLVALLADPDKKVKDDQEDEELQLLEAKAILPLIRAIFRNVAEGMNALEFVNSRTKVETIASERMREELRKFRISTEGVFIGNIDLDDTEAGKQLIATQTDRELAINQQQTFIEKKKAEESRSTFVKAQEEANQQKQLAEATYAVRVKEQQALAREQEAKGEALYITITAEAKRKAYEMLVAAIGQEGVVQLETLKQVAEGRIDITPNVFVNGGGSVNDALAGTILNQVQPVKVERPAAAKPGK